MCYHKTNILFLLPSFRKGGEAKNTLNILNALDTERFNLYLLICSNENNDLKDYLENDVNIIELNPSTNVKASLSIIRTLQNIQPDITFTSFVELNYMVGIYKKNSTKKIISVLRFNTLPSNNLTLNLSYNSKERVNCSVEAADSIIAQSVEMRDEITKYYPSSKSKVNVISNAINHQQIKRLSDEYIPYEDYNGTTLVAIGSLWEVKGFDFLIRAVGKLVYDHNQDIRLFIVGENMTPDSGYDEYLQALIADLKLEKYISFVGYKSNPYPYLKHADVFVLSSLMEGFPNVVLEALSLHVPCVVTNCVDFSNIIIPNANGVIVQKAEVDSLVEGILEAKDIGFKKQKGSDFDYNEWFGGLLA
ncbi:glycosyltransferase [Albibacterium profundi]|uniref:Glycosyltransferase n=1 Tax=Albibacterium profundi TaxID=3134906 RepID=A0ABV5C9N5_9SPHI